MRVQLYVGQHMWITKANVMRGFHILMRHFRPHRRNTEHLHCARNFVGHTSFHGKPHPPNANLKRCPAKLVCVSWRVFTILLVLH